MYAESNINAQIRAVHWTRERQCKDSSKTRPNPVAWTILNGQQIWNETMNGWRAQEAKNQNKINSFVDSLHSFGTCVYAITIWMVYSLHLIFFVVLSVGHIRRFAKNSQVHKSYGHCECAHVNSVVIFFYLFLVLVIVLYFFCCQCCCFFSRTLPPVYSYCILQKKWRKTLSCQALHTNICAIEIYINYINWY